MSLLDRVRSAFASGGKDETRTLIRAMRGAGKNPESALALVPLSSQLTRVTKLTPQKVSQAIRDADQGTMWPLVDLLNELRQKDCHLQGILEKREGSVAELSWDLYFPNQDPKSKKGARQIKFATEALQSIPEFGAVIEHLNGAVSFGYAVAETHWGKVGGKFLPLKILRQSPRRFSFSRDTSRLVWSDMGSAEVDFREQWPDRFIVSQPRITGDIPNREGLARVLVWAGLFRNWTLADWLKLGELSWKPWRVGTYTKDASDEDIDNLSEVLEGMSSNGCAVVPETTKLEFKWPGGQTPSRASHAELFDVVGREMSKAVLGNTLTTEAGKIGSQALGSIHEKGESGRMKKDARHLSEVITRQLIEPLIRMNMGSAAVPHFRLLTEERAELESFGKGVSAIVGAGVRVPQEWVRNEAGIPHPKDGDEIASMPSATPAANDAAPADGTTPGAESPAP